MCIHLPSPLPTTHMRIIIRMMVMMMLNGNNDDNNDGNDGNNDGKIPTSTRLSRIFSIPIEHVNPAGHLNSVKQSGAINT